MTYLELLYEITKTQNRLPDTAAKPDTNVVKADFGNPTRNPPAGKPPAGGGGEVIVVECWTPAGHVVRIKARDQDHAEWLRKMNPKPEETPS